MRFRLLCIAWRNNRLLFLLPFIVLYLVLPIVTISAAANQNLDVSWRLFVFVLQTLAPLSILFWQMAYLNIWLDEEGEECIRGSSVRKKTAVGEIFLSVILYAIISLPVFLVAHLFFDTAYLEWLRLVSTAIFFVNVYFLLSLVFRSLIVSSMLVFAYACFSILYHGDGALKHLCLLTPRIAVSLEKMVSLYAPLAIVSALLLVLGGVIERCFHYYLA